MPWTSCGSKYADSSVALPVTLSSVAVAASEPPASSSAAPLHAAATRASAASSMSTGPRMPWSVNWLSFQAALGRQRPDRVDT